MDESLGHYIERVRALRAEPLSPPATLRGVAEALGDLLSQGVQLDPTWRQLPENGHGRNLVYEDPDSGFVVVVMVWPPGADSKPHDHGVWGAVGLLEGTLKLTDYEREDDGSDPRTARLRETSSVVATPGAVCTVLPPYAQYHRVENTSQDVAISLHTYERAIEECTLFDPETGEAEVVRPVFTNLATR